eukprot:CAMPEP_0168532856 /NCGR_PEP_ID=MMETSP0405-20121227/16620_1 /TAXON_ID=498012 /ORGANISM="Trichosphaerium sp, Strain Am-I-7 wt" /LENGTH=144 /DNA_ID=CAMNT_0008558585 /DNA_START=87 /DNA_END=518 /DNA_ORIENTATION=+
MKRVATEVFLLLAFCLNISATLVVIDSNEEPMELAPIKFRKNSITWNFTGVVLVPETATNFSGKLVMLAERGEPQEPLLMRIQRGGALGIISRTKAPGKGEFEIHFGNDDIFIPLGEVDASFDFDLLVANGSFLVDAIPDGNVW